MEWPTDLIHSSYNVKAFCLLILYHLPILQTRTGKHWLAITKPFTSYGGNQDDYKYFFLLGPTFFFLAANKFCFLIVLHYRLCCVSVGFRGEGTLQRVISCIP